MQCVLLQQIVCSTYIIKLYYYPAQNYTKGKIRKRKRVFQNKMPASKKDRDHRIRSAIACVRKGEKLTVAAANFDVPKSTLSQRLRGQKSHREAALSLQRLTPEQEKSVVDWVLLEEQCGRAPLSKRKVASFAECILRAQEDHTHLGGNWVDKFISRNPEVHGKIGRRPAKASSRLKNHDLLGSTPEPSLSPPVTTPPASSHLGEVIWTPKSAKDIDEQLRAIAREQGAPRRAERTLLRKAGKTIAQLTASLARKQYEEQRLRAELAKYGYKECQTVENNQNK